MQKGLKYVKKAFYLGVLFIYFCYKILESGFIVGWLVLKGYRGDLGCIVNYKLQNKNPWNVILFFNLVTMTPGSLCTDIMDDDQTIIVHLLHEKDTESFYASAAQIENLLSKVFVTKKEIK